MLMVKNKGKKTKGSWWYGWVKYTYYDMFTKSERESVCSTGWDFSTSGQAHREAEKLAGSLSAPDPRYKLRGKPSRSKTDRRESRLTVIEIGVSRIE